MGNARKRRTRFLMAALGASAGLVACTDATRSPTAVAREDVRARGPSIERHILRQAPPPLQRNVGDGVAVDGAGAASLTAYEIAFWAVAGMPQSIALDYTDGGPFLEIDLGAGSLWLRPDGTPFADGDSIRITATIDTTLFFVQLEPSGLRFHLAEPLRLQFWYARANPDLNADGDVDDEDVQIEVEDLGLWGQDDEGLPWYESTVEHAVSEKRFLGYLFHFSNYAISW